MIKQLENAPRVLLTAEQARLLDPRNVIPDYLVHGTGLAVMLGRVVRFEIVQFPQEKA